MFHFYSLAFHIISEFSNKMWLLHHCNLLLFLSAVLTWCNLKSGVTFVQGEKKSIRSSNFISLKCIIPLYLQFLIFRLLYFTLLSIQVEILYNINNKVSLSACLILPKAVGLAPSVLTNLCENHRCGHTPPLAAVTEDGGVSRWGKEFAVAEGKQVEFVDGLFGLTWTSQRWEERRGKL